MSPDTGRSPQARLRRRHEQRTFHQIRSHAPVSRSQLAARTGLSAQAVGSIVSALLEAGLVEETSMRRQTGPGASPVGLRLCAEGAFALGFGLERDSLNGVLLDLAGTVRWQVSRKILSGEAAATTLSGIAQESQALLESPEWRDRRRLVSGIGIAAPGPINLREGTIMGPPNFPSWNQVNLTQALGSVLDLPVVIDNAATAAAIGVEWRMPRRHGSFLYCYWGVGIGGGLVLGYEAYRGATGNAIEIGHVVVDSDGRPCECGAKGCLEAEASAAALLRDSKPYGSFTTIEDLAAAARSSEALSALLVRAAERLAAVLVSVVNITDVNEVLLGGKHLEAVRSIFLPVVKTTMAEQAFRRRIEPVRIGIARVGEEANAIGAAVLAFHTFLSAGRQPPRGRQHPESVPHLLVEAP